jgi:hypothetical protein
MQSLAQPKRFALMVVHQMPDERLSFEHAFDGRPSNGLGISRAAPKTGELSSRFLPSKCE